MEYDVIIIGGGPAGLSAGLYSARALKNTLIIESSAVGGQIMDTSEVQNLPGSVEDTSSFAIASRMEAQAREFGANIVMEEVEEVDFTGDWKVVRTNANEYKARAVIIATGSHPRKLGAPGEENFVGRGVGYCATCDGAFYTGLPVYVIGGGDSAFDEGLFLATMASKVTIVYRGDKPRAAQLLQERVANRENMEVVLNTNIVDLSGDVVLNRMVLENSVTGEQTVVEGDFGLFIFAGYQPNTQLFEDKLVLDRGYIGSDESTATEIPGVYAAGDVRRKSTRQVVTAISDGAVAAIAAGKYIDEHFS